MSANRDPLYDDKWTLQELFEDYAYALSPTMCIAVREFLDGKKWHGSQQPQRSYLRKAMERLREYARRDHMVVSDNIRYHIAHGGGWPERRLCYYSEQFRRASARSVRARPMRAFQETGESEE